MSAICGVVNFDEQPVEASAIERMMTALEVYGPDGAKLWREDNAAFGHQMLHITPESLQEKLPWQDPTTGLVITADARIDNRSEIFAALSISPQASREISDSQLILQAYLKWGEECPQKLLGDFSFAIWDTRHQKLFCARDIMGVRPFYYYRSKTCFIFASDLKGLLATCIVPSQLNEAAIGAFLLQEDIIFAQKSLTFYEEIYKLPAACRFSLTSSKQEVGCYWFPEDAPQIELGSEAEYLEMLRKLLEQAVRCRLRSAFPIGTHLSGGLDSSAIGVIASHMLQESGRSLTGFSWSPPLTEVGACSEDERTFIAEICDREQIKCNYVSLTGQDLTNVRNRDFTTEPTEMLYFEQLVQAEAAKSKMRVLLSGWGGDEAITFNGRGYFAELFQKGRWWHLYRELKLRGKLHGLNLRGQIFEKIILPLLPDKMYTRLGSLMNRQEILPTGSDYIQPEFAQQIKSEIEQMPRLSKLLRERSRVRTNQQMLLNYGHLTNRIESWAIGGAKHQLVYSYPLLDRRILEFALGVPIDLFFKHGWKRYLFRSATESILPDRVRWNKTKREPAILEQWMSSRDYSDLTFEEIAKQSFQTHRQSSKLSKYLNMQLLEEALMNKELRQPGFLAALSFVISCAEK
ncbi:MAG: asparagine synthase-related protein [Cyanobacteria bacterium J06648_1]